MTIQALAAWLKTQYQKLTKDVIIQQRQQKRLAQTKEALAPIAADGINAKEVKNRRLQDQEQANTRIIGGSEAVEDCFSYVVSLHYLLGHNCGGSLIAKDLTAAHCGSPTSAVLGRHNHFDGNGEVRRDPCPGGAAPS